MKIVRYNPFWFPSPNGEARFNLVDMEYPFTNSQLSFRPLTGKLDSIHESWLDVQGRALYQFPSPNGEARFNLARFAR